MLKDNFLNGVVTIASLALDVEVRRMRIPLKAVKIYSDGQNRPGQVAFCKTNIYFLDHNSIHNKTWKVKFLHNMQYVHIVWNLLKMASFNFKNFKK